MIIVLKSKIHKAHVTHVSPMYEGSLTLDEELMNAAGIYPYEKVLVANLSNGNRFETYAIKGPSGSRIICLNGAAAKLGAVGDLITIMAFTIVKERAAKKIKPNVIVLGENNEIIAKKPKGPL